MYDLNPKQVMEERIAEFKADNYVYVYGAKYTGKPITESEITVFRNQNSQVYTDKYYKDSLKQAGRYAIDCSGLVCRIWGIPDVGSWQISEFKSADGFQNLTYTKSANLRFGDCVWKSGHVGFALNMNEIYEAKGLYVGLRISEREVTQWQKIIRPTEIKSYDYLTLGWQHEASTGRWWYAYGHNRGEYYKDTAAVLNGKPYLFNEEGYLVANPEVITGKDGAVTHIGGTVYTS